MNITFFESKPKGRADAPPSVSIRPQGQVTLNNAAVKLLEAEAGEAATLGYDTDGRRWLLAHWPNGKAGQPELRATGANAKTSLRFQAKGPTAVFYTQLPAAERGRSSVACSMAATAIEDEQHPGASFYVLSLPDELPQPVVPAAKASTSKQPGVGRGRYARASQAQKGAVSRG